jgi:hypothetical protein
VARLGVALAVAALAAATPASAGLHAFHCAFDLDFSVDGHRSTTRHNAMLIVDTDGRSLCIVDDHEAGNAGGAVDVARLYDSLDTPGASTRPYCVPGRRFGSFPNRARIERLSESGLTVSYRFLADGSGGVIDIALPSLAMTFSDPPGVPSGFSGRGSCRTKRLGPYFQY